MNSKEDFDKKNILITGGMGFIGSNLAHKLVELGANVTIVDSMLPGLGGNLFNVNEIKDKININYGDIRDISLMENLVKEKDYIFHLAGQVSHVDSIKDPYTDLDINCKGTLVILESCRKYNQKAKIIFTGTRGQYGSGVKFPVDEGAPTNPKGIYAITNLAAEKMVLTYDNLYGIRCVCLRITNTYGPRHQMKHDRYGVLNWFIRRAIDNKEIEIMGNGKILRDFLFVDDCVEALLMVAVDDKANSQIFNVASGKPISFIELAKKIIKIADSGSIKFVDFTEERKALEPGDFYADISKIKKNIGWEPKINLDEGLKSTIYFYKKYKDKYW